jgi:hypothetical protein
MVEEVSPEPWNITMGCSVVQPTTGSTIVPPYVDGTQLVVAGGASQIVRVALAAMRTAAPVVKWNWARRPGWG